MPQKITYSVVIGHAGKVDRFGLHLVQIQAYQSHRTVHFSTGIRVRRDQFAGGLVTEHPLAVRYNAYLYKMRNEIEALELDMLLRGREVTLPMLKAAYLDHISISVPLRDFAVSVIEQSERCTHTKQSYRTLLRDVESFRPGTTLVDIDYDFLVRFRSFLQERHLAANTIINRLRCLRALINEGVRRRLMTQEENPFNVFRIPSMTARKVRLTASELRKVERLPLAGRERRVRDAFLFASYTGLRYSDLVTLRSEHFVGDLIVKETVKTGRIVRLPYRILFHGAIIPLIEQWGSVESLLRLGHNATANKTLRHIINDLAHIPKHITFHAARHFFATELNASGLSMQEIQQLLAHEQLVTTSETYAETDTRQLRKALKKAFK